MDSLFKKTKKINRLLYFNNKIQSALLLTSKWIFLLVFALNAQWVTAQVQFKIALDEDEVTYRVSMLPAVTWDAPDNIVSTAQIVLKVPSGGFSVSNVETAIPTTFWANNARYNSPLEDSNSDYIAFGLTSLGTNAIPFVSGEEVLLFSFVNDGICTGAVELINTSDPFYPPNSLNANVTNQISTLGSGIDVNAFSGAYEVGGANCQSDFICPIEYQLAQLSNGTYTISLLVDIEWETPLNFTDLMQVTVVAPTGSLNPANISNTQPNIRFDLTGEIIAPAANPNFDYFSFNLQGGVNSSISYYRGLNIPLFTFENSGSCQGDSLFLINPDTDAFLLSNPTENIGNFIRTRGSNETIVGCVRPRKLPIQPSALEVATSDLTNCNSDNGSITLNSQSLTNLEYSLDSINWQESNQFTLLSEGNYDIVYRFANGTCPTKLTQNPITINAPNPPTVNVINPFNPSDCGVSDGRITIQASSDVSPEYSIDGGDTWEQSGNFNNLPEATYFVAVRNGNGTCIVQADTIHLDFEEVSSPVIDSINFTSPSSCSANNGSINIFTKDSIDYEYSIDNGQSWTPNPNFLNLSLGSYNIQTRNTIDNCISVYTENPIYLENNECNRCLFTYELELLSDGRFQVSLTSDTTWNVPQSITSTAQITIVAPTQEFEVIELTNLIPGVDFNNNSIIVAPPDNPTEDYISFGLESLGTTNIPYEKGRKVPLFTFRNISECAGVNIRLMDSDTDPFAFPNSLSVNVGQQLSTAGSGQDGRVCIQSPGFAPCTPFVEAINDTFNIFLNTTSIENVLNNDIGSSGVPLNVFVVDSNTVTRGDLLVDPSGEITYTPDFNFTGIDSLTYTVCESTFPFTCSDGKVYLLVGAANDVDAIEDSYSVFINQMLTEETLLANDIIENRDMLSISVQTSPANGELTIADDGTFIYTPNQGFNGFDFFEYEVCDNSYPIVCDVANVTIEVTGGDELTALNDSYIDIFDNPLMVNVTDNDINPDSLQLIVQLSPVDTVENGQLELDSLGNIIYNPNSGFIGIDDFTYIVCDKNDDSVCDTATVMITVVPVVMALNDSFSLQYNERLDSTVHSNDLYPQGLMVETRLLSNPTKGTLSLNEDGTFSFSVLNETIGLDSFSYEICDVLTGAGCDTAVAYIMILSAVVANDDLFAALSDNRINESVITNDEFPTSIITGIRLLEDVENGTLLFNPDGSFDYFHENGFTGADAFTYELCDNAMPRNCDTATVNILITSELAANDDDFRMTNEETLNDNVVANDLIPTGLNFEVTLIPSPLDGNLDLAPDGQFSFIPEGNFVGIATFMYQICELNNLENCDTATVNINVNESPTDPMTTAIDDIINTAIGTSVNGNVAANDLPTGNDLVVNPIPVVSPTSGNLLLNPDGTFSFVPENNEAGTIRFDYEICLEELGNNCDTGSVIINYFDDNTPINTPETPVVNCPENICGNESTNLIIQNNYTGNIITYEWINGLGNIISTNPSLQINATNNALIPPFRVRVFVDGTPSAYTSACSPSFVQIPEVNIEYTNSSTCEGGRIDLTSDANFPDLIESYSWVGPNGFTANSANASIQNTTIQANGTYTLTAIGQNGCQQQQQLQINEINAIPEKPQVIANITPCATDEIFMTIQNPEQNPLAIYTWTNNEGDTVGMGTMISIIASSTEARPPFKVRTALDGCLSDYSDGVDINIDLPNAPVLSINENLLCEGNRLQLDVTPYMGQEIKYQWFFERDGNEFLLDETDNPTLILNNIQATNEGVYSVVAFIDDCRTPVSNLQQLTVFSPANPLVVQNSTSIDNPACEGDLVQFSAPFYEGATYNWFGPLGFNSQSYNPILESVSPEQAGSYFVVFEYNGCTTVSEETVVMVNEIESNFILNAPIEICEGDDLVLEVLSPTLDTKLIFEYYESELNRRLDSTKSNRITIPNVNIAQGGNYHVIIYTGDGCSIREDAVVRVDDIPDDNAVIQQEVISMCEEDELILQAEMPSFGIGNWNSPNNVEIANPSQPETLVENLAEGQNIFIWSLSNGGCTDYSRDSLIIFVEAAPFANADNYELGLNDSLTFNVLENDKFSNDTTTELIVTKFPDNGVLIEEGDGSFSYKPNRNFFGEDNFRYRLCNLNCENACDTAIVNLVVGGVDESGFCFISDVFSPNDDGVNDVFLISCIDDFPNNEISIFNRWGDLVYKTQNYQNDWDGTYNGQPLPSGTYFYILNTSEASQRAIQGYFTLFR